MKTFIVIFLIVLFVATLVGYCFFSEKKEKKTKSMKDERIRKINRAKKNLHPVINRNVDRDDAGRFCKKK